MIVKYAQSKFKDNVLRFLTNCLKLKIIEMRGIPYISLVIAATRISMRSEGSKPSKEVTVNRYETMSLRPRKVAMESGVLPSLLRINGSLLFFFTISLAIVTIPNFAAKQRAVSPSMFVRSKSCSFKNRTTSFTKAVCFDAHAMWRTVSRASVIVSRMASGYLLTITLASCQLPFRAAR